METKLITKKQANLIKIYVRKMVKFVNCDTEKESDLALDEALHYRRRLQDFLDNAEITLIRDLSYAKGNQCSSQLTYENIFKILEIIFSIKVEEKLV